MTRRPTDPTAGDAAAASVVAELPDPLLVVAVLVLWVGSGLVIATLLAARGHEFRALAGLAGAMGPLFLPLALDHHRRRDPQTVPVAVHGELVAGRRTVVLLAGEPERAADALPVLRRLADPGSVTLAVPIGFSTLRAPEHDTARLAAWQRAEQAALFLGEFSAVPVLAPGTPMDVVQRLVSDERDLVLIVGQCTATDRANIDRAGVPVVAVPRSGGR